MIRVGPLPGGALASRVRNNLARWRAAEARRDQEEPAARGFRARLASFRDAASALSPRARARLRARALFARRLSECADLADNLLDAICDTAQYGITEKRRSSYQQSRYALHGTLEQLDPAAGCSNLRHVASEERLEVWLHSDLSILYLTASRMETQRLRDRAAELSSQGPRPPRPS